MKLWQKIFLTTLCLVIIAVNVTAIFVLQTNFHTIIQREREQAILRQVYLTSTITSQIVTKKMKNDQGLLDQTEVHKIIEDLPLTQYNTEQINIMIMHDQKLILGSQSEVVTQQQDFLKQVEKSQNIITNICDHQSQTYLITGSSLTLENDPYLVITLLDITELYSQYHNQFLIVILLSFGFAGALSIILFFITVHLLKPLKQLNETILLIAQGHYDLRLKETGSIEFIELSSNVNTMAQSIEEKTLKLEQLAESRQQFINHFAHEMKTPLTSILGFADIMRIKKSVDDEERQEYAHIIMEEAKRLKVLSAKLLELATTKEMLIEHENVSVIELFHDIHLTIQPILQKKNLTLDIQALDIEIAIDKQFMKSFLYNLLDNAIKASYEQGKIELKCYRKDHDLVIEVSDHGIGMSEETVKNAMEPFYMEDKSRSRKSGGVGLGLTLCYEIAKVHQAQFYIESEQGKGTSAYLIWKGSFDNE